MDAAAPGNSLISARPFPTMRFYYTKRSDPSNPTTKRAVTSLGRQVLLPYADSTNLPLPPCTNEEFEVGSFYEIDHGNLPPKSPTQLKEIRVVMVSEKTKLDVTVSFPSTFSLREYFNVVNADFPAGHGKRKSAHVGHPELDEQFVMSTNHAGRILRRLVPKTEVDGRQHLEKFWVVCPKVYDLPTLSERQLEVEESPEAKVAQTDSCLQALKSAVGLSWGVRRRVRYIGRHKGKPMFSTGALVQKPWSSSVAPIKEETTEKVELTRVKKKARRPKKKSIDKKKKKKPKLELEVGSASNDNTQRFKSSKDRWSAERYEAAELKLLNIMKEKGAVLGNPILRPDLREEARKHIGDTGLLDHLLKHMAGKVVSDGKERFRRRHNPEGAMEYWLEDVELADARLKAGVADPCWAPPPGWKPGDVISSCGMVWGLELNKLKEEIICTLKRDVGQLQCLQLQQQEKNAQDKQPVEAEAGNSSTAAPLQDLLLWKDNVEDLLSGLKEDVRLLREEMKLMKEQQKQRQLPEDKEEEEKSSCVVVAGGDEKMRNQDKFENQNCATNNNKNISSKCSGKNARVVRKSGFRICKPQGTFLWPSMVAVASTGGGGSISCNSSVVSASPKVVVPFEDVFGVPTPHSASSATSPPTLPSLPAPPNNNSTAITTTTSSSSPVKKTARAQLVVACHRQPPQELLQVERTGSSSDATVFQIPSPHVPVQLAASSTPTSLGGREEAWVGRNGGGAGRGGVEAWSIISTDLALASPSYHH